MTMLPYGVRCLCKPVLIIMLILLCSSLLDKKMTVSARRRTSLKFVIILCANMLTIICIGCIPRLCRKCELYVHSRWRRSLPDEPEEMSSEFIWSDKQKTWMHESMYEQSYPMNENGDELASVSNGRRASQDTNLDDGLTIDSNGARSRNDARSDSIQNIKKKTSRTIQKRSSLSHLLRCIYLLRRPCCKKYTQSVVYIGYRA